MVDRVTELKRLIDFLPKRDSLTEEENILYQKLLDEASEETGICKKNINSIKHKNSPILV